MVCAPISSGESPRKSAILPRHLFYERGLVALAAMRHRREKRRIGLNEHAVERNHAGSVANVLRLGKGDVAGKGDHEAQIERRMCVSTVPVKQCRTPPNPARRPVLAIRRRESSHAFSLLSEGRQWMMMGSLAACANSSCEEDPLLHVARRMIVKVVETDLAPGNDLRVPCELR